MKQSAKVINHCGICSPQYAYIMGFICHYTLDNACHPLIHQFMNSTDCGHVEIEGDMENLILTLDGISPASYPMYKLVPTGKAIAHCMKDFFPELSCREIANSLEMMNIIKRMFVAPGCIKRHVLESIMRLSLHYKKLKGHLIYPYANIKCRKETELLYNTLINSVPDAVYLINNFTNYALSGTMLTDKFHRDFNNRYFV
jgi:hypothetical protein